MDIVFFFGLQSLLVVFCVNLLWSSLVWSIALLATVVLLVSRLWLFLFSVCSDSGLVVCFPLVSWLIEVVFLVWEFTTVNSVGGDSLVVGVSSGSGYPWKGGTAFPGVFSFCCGVGRCFSFVPVSLFILADFRVMSSVGSVPLGREPVVVAWA